MDQQNQGIVNKERKEKPHLNYQTKQCVLNLLEYFSHEKEHGGPFEKINAVQLRTANALKISISTVQRIQREAKNSPDCMLPLPKKKLKKRKPKVNNTDQTKVSKAKSNKKSNPKVENNKEENNIVIAPQPVQIPQPTTDACTGGYTITYDNKTYFVTNQPAPTMLTEEEKKQLQQQQPQPQFYTMTQ